MVDCIGYAFKMRWKHKWRILKIFKTNKSCLTWRNNTYIIYRIPQPIYVKFHKAVANGAERVSNSVA